MSRPKSIKFIEVEKNKLRLTKEAIELLEEQKEPFGVLVCLGPYRMGKSYLLNRIVEEKTAFGVGHTDLGETKGLYIFDRLVQIGDDKGLDYGPKFLVLDTEGLQSDDNSEEVDTKLFLISFLLSSLLIYNTKSALNRETFNQLDIITNLSEKVKVRRRTEDDDRPDLLWVVRDYSLHSTKRPNERVQDFLESEKFEFDSDSSKQANEKRAERVAQRNKVREAMINSFHSFGCHYFPVPISDGTAGLSFEEAMQSMNRLDIDDLRPEFNLEMDRLKKSIGEKMRLKSVGGKVFSDGRFYMDFIQQCIDKINTDSSILDSDFELFWINKKIEKMEEEHKKKLKEKEERIDNLSDLIAQLKESNQDLEKKVEDLKTEINERKNKQEALESAQKSKSTLKTSDDEDETIYKVSPRNLTTNSRTPDLLNTSALSYTSASITEYNYPSPACSQTSISGEGSKYHPANIRNKSTTTPTSTYYPPSPPSSVCGSSSTLKMLYNKDGTPDKRCSAYRASLVGSDGVPRNSNGKPDMRYTENKIRFGGHNY